LSAKRFATLLIEQGLLVTALLVTAGLSALTTMRVVLTSQEVVVPSLVERRLPEASGLASRHRLLVRVEGRRHDPHTPAEHIAAQEPPAGSTLKANRSIRVWVSLGPRRIDVPDVRGESLRAARLSLEQIQIPVVRVVEIDAALPASNVVLQQPPPGETDDLGEGAVLLVSRGSRARDVVMPDLIGRPEPYVQALFERAGLRRADVRLRAYPGVPAGVVLRQTPPAGYRVGPETAITLEVSRPQGGEIP
jgi:beta-lactam-binding protein with PASTA domain